MHTTASTRTTHLMVVPLRCVPDILSGRRTVEPRLGRDRRAPYGRVAPGDLVYIMTTGGPVFAACTVERVDEFDDLSASDIDRLQDAYEPRALAGAEFWSSKRDAAFATLVWFGAVRPVRDASCVPAELTAPSRHAWRSTAATEAPARRAA